MLKTDSVISILVWNYPEYVENLFLSLLKFKISKYPYEIYFLDQNSDEKTKQLLTQTRLPIHLITLETNIGFSKGHNLILKKASEEFDFNYLCLINSDIKIEEDYWLDKLNEKLDKSHKNAIAGPSGVRINMSKQNYCDGIIATQEEMEAGNYDLISGSFFSIKMDIVKKIKLFDEIFTPAYFEDADLNLRCKNNGYRLIYVPIKHKHDYLNLRTSEDRLRNEELTIKFGNYYSNNKLIFIKRWESYKFFKKVKIDYAIEIKKKIKSIFNKKNQKLLQKKFTDIFNNNLFLGKESISGTGSDLTQTEVIRSEIPKLFKKYNIKSFIDAPCGDFYWMQHVKLYGINYIGIDIVKELVKTNIKKFKNPTRKFLCKNILTDKLPVADLILIRDCWVHLTSNDVFSCVKNLKRSKIKYLMATSFTEMVLNNELDGIWRPINLELSPFNFPKPIELINEGCTEDEGKFKDKSLILWEISSLPDY